MKYVVGQWFGLVAPAGCLILSPRFGPERVGRLWGVLERGEGFAGALREVMAESGTDLAALPEFGIVVFEEGGAHIALRGGLTVRGRTPGGAVLIDGRGVLTWREEIIAEPVGLVVSCDGDGQSEDETWWPLVSGVAHVSVVDPLPGDGNPLPELEQAGPITALPPGDPGPSNGVDAPVVRPLPVATPMAGVAPMPGVPPMPGAPPVAGAPHLAGTTPVPVGTPLVIADEPPTGPGDPGLPDALDEPMAGPSTGETTLMPDDLGEAGDSDEEDSELHSTTHYRAYFMDPAPGAPAAGVAGGALHGSDPADRGSAQVPLSGPGLASGSDLAGTGPVRQSGPGGTGLVSHFGQAGTGPTIRPDAVDAGSTSPPDTPGDLDDHDGHTILTARDGYPGGQADDHDGFTVLSAAGPDDDHDGMTVMSQPGGPDPDRLPPPPPPPAGPVVLARICAGCRTANPTTRVDCRACGAGLFGEARQIPRPVLGRVQLPSGEILPIDHPIVLGRRPEALRFSNSDIPVLRPVDDPHISSVHLRIDLEDWSVLVTSLGRNGTILKRPGEPDRRFAEGEQVLAQAGDVYALTNQLAVAILELA